MKNHFAAWFSLVAAAAVLTTGCGSSSPSSAVSASQVASSSGSSTTPGGSGTNGGTGTGTDGGSGSGTGTGSGSGTGTGSGSGTGTGSGSGTGTGSGSGTGTGTGTDGGSGTGTGTGSGTGTSGGSGNSLPAQVPANAKAVSDVQIVSSWKATYDTDTSGSSGSASGIMSIVGSPSQSGQAREFDTTWTNYGGERYSASFASDAQATNFFYDGWVYLSGDPSGLANLELDMNQVMPNGQTVIFGFQCDGYSHTWDYTQNTGTPKAPVVHWVKSQQPCNVQDWSVETWHHVQVSYSRDNSGNVTYNTVWLDDVEQPIRATVPSAFALGWKTGVLLTNFQVDGRGASGSATVYLDNLTVYRW